MRTGKPQLPQEIYEHDFVSLARKTSHGKTKLRLLGMSHLQEGKGFAEIGRMLKVSWVAVRNWLARFKEQGLEGLQEQHRSGRKSHLAKADEEAFKAAVEQLQAERPGGRVRAKDIQQLLQQDFQASYDLDSVYVLLKRLGMVWITARSQHPKADRSAQAAFKKLYRRGQARDTAGCGLEPGRHLVSRRGPRRSTKHVDPRMGEERDTAAGYPATPI